MNDAEIREYLLSHAPLDRFYLYAPGGQADGLIRFTDPAGRAFVLAEDDDDLARHAIAVLKALGVRIFEDFLNCCNTPLTLKTVMRTLSLNTRE